MNELIDTYDWEQAFSFADGVDRSTASAASYPDDVSKGIGVANAKGFSREDVETIYVCIEGENDAEDWLGVFKLKDGRYACLRAGCDYTGWG